MSEQNILEFVGSYAAQEHKRRRVFKVATSLVIHLLVIGAFIVGPLLFVMDDLPEVQSVPTFLVLGEPALPPPPPPPPPAPASPPPGTPSRRPDEKESPRRRADLRLTEPVEIPDKIIPESNFGLGDFDLGVPGGVEGGVPGGVLQGIVGGLPDSPVEAEPPQEPVRLAFSSEGGTPIRKVDPNYPYLALMSRAQGVVVIEVLVDRNGKPQTCNVLRSAPLLDSAAVDAVEQWRWKPYKLRGEVVPFWVTVTVIFQLTDAAGD